MLDRKSLRFITSPVLVFNTLRGSNVRDGCSKREFELDFQKIFSRRIENRCSVNDRVLLGELLYTLRMRFILG